jgi:Domain of unknown function (DUF5753)
MHQQIEHLLELAQLPNVAIQVIPFGSGAHPAMGRSFAILSFAERADPDVVYLQDLTSALYLEDLQGVGEDDSADDANAEHQAASPVG